MRTPLLVTSIALAAAACSSSTPTAVETPAPSPSPTASPSALPVVPPSPTTSPSPTATATPVVPHGSESPAPVGQPTCNPAAVTITDADTVTPRGTSYRAEVYVLRTRGRACQLTGYPTVAVAGATVTHGGEGLPPETPKTYTLSAGTSLSFSLATARSGSCTDRTAISVILPGTSQRKAVTTDLQVCNGRLGVSPVHRLGDDE